jgi:CBS domain-containing protein
MGGQAVQLTSRGVRVQIFLGETDQVGHVPRYQAILEYLRKEGAAGATVVRGVAGFGANSKIHTAAILRLSLDLPMILTWVDAPGRVERLLPAVRELAGSGIVTVEEVGIVAYGGRRLEQLRFDLPVQDVMNRDVVAVRDDAPARIAVELLVGKPFRALPVVDVDGRVLGVVSSGDLVARAGLGARLELLSAMSESARHGFLDQVAARPVREVMTGNPATTRTTDAVRSATHTMADRKLKRLPVVDAEGRLAGILARSDVLRAVGETFPRDLAAAPEHAGARAVGDVMRTDAPVASADATVPELLDVVVSTRLNRAVVIDSDGRVIGVVTDADLIRIVDPSASVGIVEALMGAAGRPPSAKVTARELLTRPPLTVGPSTPIAEAARLMTERGFKILCVVDTGGRLLGIVDRADLLRAAGAALRDLASASRDRDDDGD